MDIKTSLQTPFKRLSFIAGGLALALGVSVLMGWAFDVVTLKSLWPGLATMKVNTAFCFELAGASLCLSTLIDTRRWPWNAVRLCGLMILLIGALSLVEDVWQIDAGIDQLLFRDFASIRAPGRMSPATAFSWIAVGTGLMLVATERKRWRALAQWPALLVALGALVALAGYIYSAEQLYAFGPYASIALHTAIGLLIIATGLLCMPPHGSLITLVRSQRLGGTAARRLLPVVIVLPLIGGWIRLDAQRRGWVGTDLGTALFATGLVVMLVSIVWAITQAIEFIDRKRELAIEALRESEQRFRALIEHSHDAIALFGADGSVLYASPSTTRVMGYHPEELLQRKLFEFVRPDWHDEVREKMTEVLRRPNVGIPTAAYVQHKDGEYRFLEGTFTNLLDERSVGAIVNNYRDITEHKQANEKLRESEEKYRAILERMQEGYAEVDLRGSYVLVNDSFCRISGRSHSELVGANYQEFLDHEHWQLLYETYHRVYLTGEPVNGIEYVVTRKDGTKRLVEESVNLKTDAEGRPMGFTGIRRDVTERKRAEAALLESEEKLILAMSASNMGSWVLNIETLKFEANAVAKVMHGFAADEPISEIYQSLTHVHPEDISETKQRFKQAFQTRGPFEGEYRVVLPDGSTRWISSQGSVDKGTPYLTGMVQDITERKQAEERLQLSEKKFSDAFQTSPAGITITRIADGRFIDVNEMFLRMFEFNREEVIGHTSIELNILSPEERERLIGAQLEAGGLRNAELVARTKSNRLINLLFSSKPIEWEGETHHITTLIDTTDLKLAEVALRESEARLRLSVEAADVGLWDWNLVTNEVFFSPNWKRQLGYTDDDLPNQYEEWESRLHPEDRETTLAAVIDFREGRREDYDVEFRLRHKDGSYRWIYTHGDVLQDVAGKAVRMLGCHIDITERKRNEAALRETREQLESALAAGSVGTWVWDLVNNRTLADEYLSELFSIKSDSDADGDALDIFFQAIDEEDRPHVRDAIERTIKFDEKYEVEFRVQPLNKKPRWLLGRGRIERDAAGNPLRFLGMLMDITERKRAEEALRQREDQYRDLVDNMRDLVCTHDLDGRVLFVNRSSASLLGYEPHELVGRNLREALDPDTRHLFDDYLRTIQANGEASGLMRVRTRSGESRLWEYHNTVRMESSSAPTVRGLARDITERKRAEEALRASRDQLRALSARVQVAREDEGTRIAREIHDELGGLLTALKWDIERVDKLLSSSDAGERVQPVLEKIPAITGLIDATIDTVRRISSELRPGVLDDLGLVSAIEWHAEQFQQRTGIMVQCESTGDVNISRDRAIAAFRIFQEILTNVMRHAQATLVTVRMSNDNAQFFMEVFDNGRGIDSEALRTMSSLGLLGMRERAHLVGGVVDFTSATGKGTRVIVSVPLEPESVPSPLSY